MKRGRQRVSNTPRRAEGVSRNLSGSGSLVEKGEANSPSPLWCRSPLPPSPTRLPPRPLPLRPRLRACILSLPSLAENPHPSTKDWKQKRSVGKVGLMKGMDRKGRGEEGRRGLGGRGTKKGGRTSEGALWLPGDMVVGGVE